MNITTLVCKVPTGICNIYGSSNCDDCRRCKPGYKGDRCQFCDEGYVIVRGNNGTTTVEGVGVKCSKLSC